MYDTIKLKSPYLSEEFVLEILDRARKKECFDLKIRQAVSVSTGEVLYQLTTGQLEGSYDSRISIRVDDKEWKRDLPGWKRVLKNPECIKNNTPVLCDTSPYIIIEASVHKAMLGHNIFGGPKDFIKAAEWLINKVSEIINLKLPDYKDWFVLRVDVAEVYLLKNFEACNEWFLGMKNVKFPRREVYTFGSTGLYAKGSTSTVKFYHKGPEFSIHDRKKLCKIMTIEKINKLQELANRIIRVEVEIKKEKLDRDYGKTPLVIEICDEYLHKIHDKEVSKMLREGAEGMKVVRRSKNVQKRLYSIYSDVHASSLFGTWYKLTTLGEEEVRSKYKRSTYYKHLKALKDAGVSWQNTDIKVFLDEVMQVLDEDFTPIRNDVRRLDIEIEDVWIYLDELKKEII